MTPNDPEEIEELEELEDVEELESAPDNKPAAKKAAGAGGRPKSSRDMGPRKLQVGEKRELEQAPIQLRKAAQVLLYGSLLPFFFGVHYSSAAASSEFGGWASGSEGSFPWLLVLGAKGLTLLGCWLFHEGYQATHGGKHKSPIAKLAKSHSAMTPLLAGIVWIAAIVWVFMAGTPTYTAPGFEAAVELGNGRLVIELMSLILAGATITHIFGYEHGGKFNPIFPLMFAGPAIAGIVNLFSFGNVTSSDSSGPGMLGLVGSIVIAVGGFMACKTMMDSMKEAKVAGEIRQAAIREERKRQRDERR